MSNRLLYGWLPSLFLAVPLLLAADDPPDKPDEPVRLKKKDKPRPPEDKPADKKAQPADKKVEPPKKKSAAKDDGEPEPKDLDKDAKEILARVTKNMRTSEARLDKKDSGDATQQVQRDILKDLDSLIEESKKNQQSQQNSRTTMRKRNQKNQRDSQSSQEQQSEQEREAEARRNAEKNKSGQANQSANNPGGGGKSKEELSKNEDLFKDIWGHLPEMLRQEMNTYSREKFMMKYQELIKQYYATLAEKNRKKE